MTPKFALALSTEGIVLYHRVKRGWRQIGEAKVDAGDLAGTLEAMRRTATTLEAGGLATKLILPNDQIRILHLPHSVNGAEDVEAALDGATPYEVSELAYDWVVRNGRTEIAVCARETLEEAEAFATGHRFNPVAFVANPEGGLFEAEAFFGPTRAAGAILGSGSPPRRDPEPFVVVARRARPDVAEPKPEPFVEGGAKDAASAGPGSDGPGTEDTGKKPGEALRAKASAGNAGDAGDKGDTAGPASAIAAAPRPEDAGEKAAARDATESTPPPAEASPQNDPAGSAPDEATAPPSAVLSGDAAPAPGGKTVPATLAEPVLQVRPGVGPSPAAPAVAATPKPGRTAPVKIAAVLPEKGEPSPAPLAAPAELQAEPGPPPRRLTPLISDFDDSEEYPTPPDGVLASLTADRPRKLPEPSSPRGGAAAFFTRRRAGENEEPRAARAPAGSRTAAMRPRFVPSFAGSGSGGAVAERRIGGKPRFLGLILTALLLLMLAAVAAWAALTVEDRSVRGFLRPQPVQTVSIPIAAEVDIASLGGERLDPPRSERPLARPPLAALVPAPRPSETAPAATDQPDAAASIPPGGEDAVPEAPGPEIFALPGGLPAAAPESLAEPAPSPAPAVPDAALAGAGVGAIAPDAAQPSGLPLAAIAAVADPPARPGLPASGGYLDVYLASIDAAVMPSDALALPGADAVAPATPAPRLAPEVLAALAAPGAFGDAGEIGAGGVPVAPGTPSDTAVPRQSGLAADVETPLQDPTTAEAAAPDLPEDVAALRPAARPAGLSIANERALLGGYTREELAALRPVVRPDVADATGPPEPAETPAIAAAEAESVLPPDAPGPATSLRPAARPQAVAAAARALAARPDAGPAAAASTAVTAAAAAAAPAPTAQPAPTAAPEPRQAAAAPRAPVPDVPSSASVARAATVEGGINLRQVNLISVSGTPANRQALVRMPNGRVTLVRVGDSVDGGRVLAISENRLQYQRRGRNIVLEIPSG